MQRTVPRRRGDEPLGNLHYRYEFSPVVPRRRREPERERVAQSCGPNTPSLRSTPATSRSWMRPTSATIESTERGDRRPSGRRVGSDAPPETARLRPRQRRRDARVQGNRRALLGRPGRGTRCGWCGPCRTPRTRRARFARRNSAGVRQYVGARSPGRSFEQVQWWSCGRVVCAHAGDAVEGGRTRPRTPDQPRPGACLIPQTAGRTSGRSPARPARSTPARRPAPGGSHTAGP
jgi:hypothetical protein